MGSNQASSGGSGNGRQPSEQEMFVGLNLLSKIGVIFIIIGVIAFSAISADIIPSLARFAVILALGAAMLGLGELFVRRGSGAFAAALTLGGIAELFVAILIGSRGLRAISGSAALGLGVIVTAAGLFLSCRGRGRGSLPAAIITAVGAFLPAFSILDPLGRFLVWIYIVICGAGIALSSLRSGYRSMMATGAVCSGLTILFMSFGAFTLGMPSMLPMACAVCCAAVFSGLAAMEAKGRSGISAAYVAALVISQSFVIIMTVIAIWYGSGTRRLSGVALAVLAVLYLACAVLFGWRGALPSANKHGDRTLSAAFENLALASAFAAIPLIFSYSAIYAAFGILSAAVLIYGKLRERPLYSVWGYIMLPLSELAFLVVCVINLLVSVSISVFITNAAVMLAVLAVYIVKGKRGLPLSIYTAAVMLNTGCVCAYLISARLIPAIASDMGTAAMRVTAGVLCALVWMLLGFVAGRLRHMEHIGVYVSSLLYIIGIICLYAANFAASSSRFGGFSEVPLIVALVVAVNIVSVLCTLDMTLHIKSAAPRFSHAVGLTVSAYALATLIVVLSTNRWLAFTSCIISVIFLLAAAVWIVVGFVRRNALLRRSGLGLVLFAAIKLFLFDFRGINAAERTLMFIGFGIAMLCISFVYGYFERKLTTKR